MKSYGRIHHLEPGEWRPRPEWAIEAAPQVMVRLKRIFARVKPWRTGVVTIVDTPEVARDLAWVLERWPMELSASDRRRLRARAREHRKTEETLHAILEGRQDPLPLMEPARPPRDYQLVAADLALTTGRLLCGDDVGLGKSFTGLLLLRDPRALPALVVTLTHLPQQWLEELHKSLPWLRGHIIRSGRVYDPAKRRGSHGHQPDVLFINYAKLAGWADHLAGTVKTVLFDEMQELRRSDSRKYVAAARVADGADFCMGLTATPVYNYGGEIHNIMSVLDQDALGTREEFIREWGAGDRGDKTGVRNPAALGQHLRDEGLFLRRTRKEVNRELPDVVRVAHSIDADEDVLEELTEDAVDLAELIVMRAAPKEELWRASGDFDWKMRQATGIAKAPYVAEFVRLLLEADEQVVLYGWHRAVYQIWLERLMEHMPVFYTGKESPAAKHRARDAFVSGASRVLVMSLRSGAGLDGLQDAAHVAVFGELDWSPGIHDQCVGRLHRDGQEEPVVAYFLVSDHGADPVMAEVLNIKRMQSEPLRDPDAQLFEQADTTGDRVRRLADDVLRKRQGRKQAA